MTAPIHALTAALEDLRSVGVGHDTNDLGRAVALAAAEIRRLRSHVPGPDSVTFDGDWLEHQAQLVFKGERTFRGLYEEIRPSWYRGRPLPGDEA